ncbi:hypothetical protein PDE_06629 [Penicillium oxalicum 114-2]|uniref:Uncharacterized protein n=1 Tax=Penicillium oxalicum (strain 114-2 / CGMCC 5302) TaxID=933388 RepID=S8BA43_PENO1|nr:hypothetical protein PDE_06629 [Penicillium oxalicum 114-2]
MVLRSTSDPADPINNDTARYHCTLTSLGPDRTVHIPPGKRALILLSCDRPGVSTVHLGPVWKGDSDDRGPMTVAAGSLQDPGMETADPEVVLSYFGHRLGQSRGFGLMEENILWNSIFWGNQICSGKGLDDTSPLIHRQNSRLHADRPDERIRVSLPFSNGMLDRGQAELVNICETLGGIIGHDRSTESWNPENFRKRQPQG